MSQSGIKAKCRRCGKESPVDEFVLDPIYKMMVCLTCVKERHLKEKVAAEIRSNKKNVASTSAISDEEHPTEAKNKPKGWDLEDEYLERVYKQKSKNMAEVITIDKERVKYECPKCKFSFIYNVLKNIPTRCTYCGSEIFPFKTD